MFSTPPNAPGRRRSECLAQVMDRQRETTTGEPATPILVASQASISETPDPNISLNQMMMSFMSEMRANQEQQRLDNESRFEEQCKEMNWRLEQMQQDMLTISQETVKTVFNQVPQLVQSAVLAVMNVAPLQLKAPTTSQPVLMITEGITTPQGSRTSAQGGSSRMRAQTQLHESAEPDPAHQRSESPQNTLADYEAITMEVDDVPQHTGSPAVG